MKVPTYQSKAAIPTQGRGLFLTAQLNAGAMMAPALADERQGQQLAQGGEQLAAWGFKKAQIGAESEALTAATEMQVQLAQAQTNALTTTDMSQAEKKYRTESQLIINKYQKQMTNTLARRAFATKAVTVQSRGLLSFTKLNNARVLEARDSNLTDVVRDFVGVASDPSQSSIARATAQVSAVFEIQEAEADLGAVKTRKRLENLYEDIAKNSLFNLANRQDADVATIATAFRNGTSKDEIIQGARENLTAEQVDSIATKLEKLAARNAKRDNDDSKKEEDMVKEAHESVVREIIFGDGSTTEKEGLFASIETSTHIPVGTLKTVRNFLDGGAQSDNSQDVLESVRAIRNGEITTDAGLIDFIDGKDITFDTLATKLLPLLTTKSDQAFTQALDWGEKTLNYDKSVGNSGIKLFEDTAIKANAFHAEMIAWQYSKKKIVTDPMVKAKEVTERLLKEGNKSAIDQLPIMTANYRKALDGGNTNTIANARTGLIQVMINAGLVNGRTAARKNFNPLDIIDEVPAK